MSLASNERYRYDLVAEFDYSPDGGHFAVIESPQVGDWRTAKPVIGETGNRHLDGQ